MYQHRVSVTGTDGKTGPNLEKAVGAHFNGPGHKVSGMSMTILEKAWNEDPMFLEQEQRKLIATFLKNLSYQYVLIHLSNVNFCIFSSCDDECVLSSRNI